MYFFVTIRATQLSLVPFAVRGTMRTGFSFRQIAFRWPHRPRCAGPIVGTMLRADRRSYSNQYKHEVGEDLLPSPTAPVSRFQSSNHPRVRRSVLTELALAPLDVRRIECATLGTSLSVNTFTKHCRGKLRTAIAATLSIPESWVDVGISRTHTYDDLRKGVPPSRLASLWVNEVHVGSKPAPPLEPPPRSSGPSARNILPSSSAEVRNTDPLCTVGDRMWMRTRALPSNSHLPNLTFPIYFAVPIRSTLSPPSSVAEKEHDCDGGADTDRRLAAEKDDDPETAAVFHALRLGMRLVNHVMTGTAPALAAISIHFADIPPLELPLAFDRVLGDLVGDKAANTELENWADDEAAAVTGGVAIS